MPERTGALIGRFGGRSAAVAKEHVTSTSAVPPPNTWIFLIPRPITRTYLKYRQLFNDWFDAPTRGRDGCYKTEAVNDLFENCVAVGLRCELRGDFDAPAFLKVGAIEPSQTELAIAGALQEEGADMRLFWISADDPDAIMEVGFGLREWLPIDDPNQRPQRQTDENDKSRRHCLVQRVSSSS